MMRITLSRLMQSLLIVKEKKIIPTLQKKFWYIYLQYNQ